MKYVNFSLKYLSEFVENKTAVVSPNYHNGKGPKSIMMLTYYRN